MTAAVKKGIKVSGACLFAVYFAGLVYFLLFAEGYGRGVEGAVYNYNIHPFQEIRRYLQYWEVLGLRYVILNLAGNVVGFLPFGALLPLIARDARKSWKIGLLAAEISAVIEVSQLLFQVGCFDVDDVILNTTGALLGYAGFWIAHRRYRRRYAR